MPEFLFDIHDTAPLSSSQYGADRNLPKIQDGIEADVGFLHHFFWHDRRSHIALAGDTFRFHMKVPEREVWFFRNLGYKFNTWTVDNSAWFVITPGYDWETTTNVYAPTTGRRRFTDSDSNTAGEQLGDDPGEIQHRAIFGGEFIELRSTIEAAATESHVEITMTMIRAPLVDKLQRQFENRGLSANDQYLKAALSRLYRTSDG